MTLRRHSSRTSRQCCTASVSKIQPKDPSTLFHSTRHGSLRRLKPCRTNLQFHNISPQKSLPLLGSQLFQLIWVQDKFPIITPVPWHARAPRNPFPLLCPISLQSLPRGQADWTRLSSIIQTLPSCLLRIFPLWRKLTPNTNAPCAALLIRPVQDDW
jgi:hypothetical protein